ncbi:signal peptidase I [Tessaracoccus aquimaris]|uniref:Signal peptidase I n=1 Tax=Tessaracoccus aquimaris TaxID=1332264 RepID=A0A1Q2CKG4_9ACTN|nr:signal peptidase I [Tessaracoccus aquimaris]AQP46604.1 signal peptidase I [Tessaracoccus aquimaris]
MEATTSDTSVDGASEKTPPSLGRRMLGWLTEGVLILVGAVIIATLLRSFVGQMFIIPSGSMENTLQVHDRVLVAKFGGFQRGDVVVFEDPGNWLAPSKQNDNDFQRVLEFIGVLPNSGTEHLIKRVIGMPGDHVKLGDDGRIEVNGSALDETAYLYSEDGVQVAPATVPFDIVVPKDRIFVMGDHRNASNDSRCRLANVSSTPGDSAFVPVDKVVGAAVAIVSPLDRLATFTVPETFEQVPAPTEPAPAEPNLIHVEPGC